MEEERAEEPSVTRQETPGGGTAEHAATVALGAESKGVHFLGDIGPNGRGSRFDVVFHDSRDLTDYLEPPPVNSNNLIDRVLVDPFTPVGFQVGKTTVSCSFITAIKRKNPLCLLNPLVLNVSW